VVGDHGQKLLQFFALAARISALHGSGTFRNVADP